MEKYLKKNNFLLVSLGAIPGAIFRWQIDEVIIVNIVGCFFLGFINALPVSRRYKLIFGFGFCGSLTTFSGWSYQLFKLINKGFYKLFFWNSILIAILGVFAVGLGHLIAKKITN